MGAVLGLAIPALVGAAICAATRIELAVFLLVIYGVLVAPSGLMAGILLVPIMGRLVTVTRLPLICIPAMCGTAIGYVSFLSYLAALCCLAGRADDPQSIADPRVWEGTDRYALF